MEISDKTISAIGTVITGDAGLSPYRSGPQLIEFFNPFGWKDTYGQGFPSRWRYAEDKLREVNGTDTLADIINAAVDPRHFLRTQYDVETAVEHLNQFLGFDGYEIVRTGLYYRVQTISGTNLGPAEEGAPSDPVTNYIEKSGLTQMNDIELIDGLLDTLAKLEYRNDSGRDAITRRAEMIIRNIFGEDSGYIQDLHEIAFHPQYGPAAERDKRERWNRGKEEMGNLFHTMKEEKTLFRASVEGDVGAESPTVAQTGHSIAHLIDVLRRFRQCCQLLDPPPESEDVVQRILWIILRSHFDQIVRHDTLPKFAAKSYIPDFGVPDLRTLLEVKFVGTKTEVARIQEEILADVPGYLNDATDYDFIVVFVYDEAHKLRDAKKFTEDLESVHGIVKVIVVPGFG